MENNLFNSCDCQAANKESNTVCGGETSFCDCDQYSCGKFTDPRWVKLNVDYFPAGFEAPDGIFKNIPPLAAHRMLAGDQSNYIVLDVKTGQEYRQQHLAGSRNLDFFSPGFKDELFGLDKDKGYVVICKIGMRSEITMNLMKKMGFKEVYNVAGGDDRWIAEEIPYPNARAAMKN